MMRSTLLFFVIGLALLAGLNVANRALGPTPKEAVNIALLRQAVGKDVVVIGASTSKSIMPDMICPDGARLDIARDAFEIEAMVDLLLSRGERPELFVIVAAPDILHADSGSRAGFGAEHRRELYRSLDALGYRGVVGQDWSNLALAYLVPGLGIEAWRPHFRWLAALAGYRIDAGRPQIGPRNFSMDPATAAKEASRRVDIRDSQNARIAYFDGELEARTSRILPRMARRIDAAGSRMAIVSPPLHRSMLDLLGPRRAELAREFATVVEAAERHGAIRIDSFDTVGISDDYRLFSDPEHLNIRGANIYSDLLAERLSESTRGSAPCLRKQPVGK